MIRVLVADDHAPIRAGVRRALEGRGFVVCAEAGDATSAVEAAIEQVPDLCLLDVNMPGSGIAAAEAISTALPRTAVVMLTVSREDAHLFDALRAGATGYLLKDLDPDQLADTLRRVVDGEPALPPALVLRVIDEFRRRGRRRRLPLLRERGVTLTEREWEVLELMLQELPTAEIARRLFITEATVRNHISHILRALRVRSRQAALDLLRDEASRA
jgi:DNA-binding NarL/FixJ family response regulator